MKKFYQKALFTAELSKEKAKKIKDFCEIENIVLSDECPEYFKEKTKDPHKADYSANDTASVDVFENHGVWFIHLALTAVESWTEKDGEFYEGCDYHNIAVFTDEQKDKIREFCGF